MRITANGDYPLYAGVSGSADDQINVLMPAVANGTCVLGYLDATGTWVPLTGGTLTAGGQFHVNHGRSSGIMIRVTAFTADFEIKVVGQT